MTLIERITEALKEENCSLEHAKSLLENEDLVTKTCWDCRNIPVQIETQASLLSEAKAEIERLGKVAEILPKLLYLQNERIYHGPDSIWAKDNPELAAYLREKQTKENTDGN